MVVVRAVDHRTAIRRQHQRVVMAAHVHAAGCPPRQHGNDVADLRLACDPAARRRHVRVEAHLQTRAVAAEPPEDPLPRRADAARGGRRVRHRVARAEAHQLLEELFQPLLGHG